VKPVPGLDRQRGWVKLAATLQLSLGDREKLTALTRRSIVFTAYDADHLSCLEVARDDPRQAVP
jgi:hypothetical protein